MHNDATAPLQPITGEGRSELVFSYLFDAEGMACGADRQTTWAWRNYALADARAARAIEGDPSLPAPVRAALTAPGEHFHLDFDGGWLHGEIPDLRHEHYSEEREFGQFRFAFDDHLFVGGRKHPLQSVEDVRLMVEKAARRFRSPAELAECLIGRSFGHIAAELSRFGRTLDLIEDRIVGDSWHGERNSLTAARRGIVLTHRHVAKVGNLFRHIGHADDELPDHLADMVARLARQAAALQQDSEQLQARARLLQDELMTKLAARSNQLLYAISVMTAVLLPMTIISGLFGMNVGGLPLLDSPHGFWVVTVFASLLAGAILLGIARISGKH